jgi:hypothetical protein
MKYYIKTQLWAKNANVDVFIFLHLMNHGKFRRMGWYLMGTMDADENFKY